MSDIRKFAVEQTSTLHLRAADGELMYDDGDESKPCVAELYGPGSKQYAKAATAKEARAMAKLRARGPKMKISAEEELEHAAEFLTDCTKDLKNVHYGDLEGRDKFRAVYGDIEIGFIAEQIKQHLADWGNFTKGSTKN